MKKKKLYIKYIEKANKNQKRVLRVGSLTVTILGAAIMFYFSAPVLLWKVVQEPAFASFIAPIPDYSQGKVLSSVDVSQSSPASQQFSGDSEFWFLGYAFEKKTAPSIASYTLSIPKIGVEQAVVSTVDSDLTKQLVQYWGTPVPPLKGNTVIFGHSTLPQLFNPNDYKTIFAKIHDLDVDDLLTVAVSADEKYTYKITKIFITTPQDLAVLDQNTERATITIITCTPPGTTWKRLIIKHELVQ